MIIALQLLSVVFVDDSPSAGFVSDSCLVWKLVHQSLEVECY